MFCSPAGQRTTGTACDPDEPRSTSRGLGPAIAGRLRRLHRRREHEAARVAVPRSWDSGSEPSSPLLAPWRRCARPRRSIAAGAVAWEHHATRIPGVVVRRPARVVVQQAQPRRAVRLASSGTPRSPAEDPDVNRALEAMTAPELRAFVRGVLEGLAPDARTGIAQELLARAVKGHAGWKPSRPAQRIVDDAKSFAEAARVAGLLAIASTPQSSVTPTESLPRRCPGGGPAIAACGPRTPT